MKYTPDYSSRFRILKGGKISLVVSAFLAGTTLIHASPTGGTVTTGSASISQTATITTINQSSNKASINWQSFSISPNETVNFVQPSSSAITLNRVVGATPSLIAGAMNANGQVFLINPNGVVFAQGSQVNVGGIVASTLNLTDANFQAGNYVFEGNSQNSVLNMGTITAAQGGYVAMMGKHVANEGTIVATMGNAQLAAGEKMSLNLNGNSLLGLTIDQGTLNALVENGGLIKADGGQVYLTTQAINTILDGMVNNTGIIEAQSLNNIDGKIVLFAHGGTANIGGTIEAEGGFVETSGKEFAIQEGAIIKAGEWLIDPVNITIDATLAGTISTALGSGNVKITTDTTDGTRLNTTSGESGTDGDITVNTAISWSSINNLFLEAHRNIYINSDITSNNMNGNLFLRYGQGDIAGQINGVEASYNIARGAKINMQDGGTFVTMLGSSGTQVIYSVVSSAAGLQNMNNTLAGNFALGSNVDFTGVTWTPIGNSSGSFTGKFDGLGHTIDNLAITSTGATQDVGFFGNTAAAEIKNIGLTNVNISVSQDSAAGGIKTGALIGTATSETLINNSYSSGIVSGYDQLGGLVGFLDASTIKNSDSSVAITGHARLGGLVGEATNSSILTKVFATGNVDDNHFTATNGGGLVGYLDSSTISSAYATGDVSVESSNAGGLVGAATDSTITASYASGNVSSKTRLGGLIGNAFLTSNGNILLNVYATGAVTAMINSAYAGGLVGSLEGGSVTNAWASGAVTVATTNSGGLFGRTYSSPTISNAYWDTTTTGRSSQVGGETPVTTGAITNANAYTQSSYTNFDFANDWFMVDGYTRPFLRMEATNTIANAHELQLMSMDLAGNYKLANDIDLAPSLTNKSEMWKDRQASIDYNNFQGSWVAIGNYDSQFNGLFDGNSHSVDNMSIVVSTGDDILDQGFFGRIGASSEVKNFSLTNALIDLEQTVNNKFTRRIGLLAGSTSSGSVIDGVSVNGAIDARSPSRTLGDIYNSFTYNNSVGGLIGENSGYISNSSSDVNIDTRGNEDSLFKWVGGLTGISTAGIVDSYSLGVVKGFQFVGGLVGRNDGAIARSYSSADVTGSMDGIGGLVGQNYSSADIGNSFSNGDIFTIYKDGDTKYATVGGFVGDNAGEISISYTTSKINSDWVNDPDGYFNNLEGFLVGSFIGVEWGRHDGTRYRSVLQANNFYDSSVNPNYGGISYYLDAYWPGVGIPDEDLANAPVGKTPAEMKNIATFDSTTPFVWNITTDSSLTDVYPQLRWATDGLGAGSSVWVIGTYTAPSSGGSGGSEGGFSNGGESSGGTTEQAQQEKTVKDVVTTIVNQTTVTTPNVPKFALSTLPNTAGHEASRTLVNAILPGQDLGLVSSPDGKQPVKAMESDELMALAASKGMNELRVPLGNDSMVDLVNGGLNLPTGVNQEFYVVSNADTTKSNGNNKADKNDKNSKKN